MAQAEVPFLAACYVHLAQVYIVHRNYGSKSFTHVQSFPLSHQEIHRKIYSRDIVVVAKCMNLLSTATIYLLIHFVALYHFCNFFPHICPQCVVIFTQFVVAAAAAKYAGRTWNGVVLCHSLARYAITQRVTSNILCWRCFVNDSHSLPGYRGHLLAMKNNLQHLCCASF